MGGPRDRGTGKRAQTDKGSEHAGWHHAQGEGVSAGRRRWADPNERWWHEGQWRVEHSTHGWWQTWGWDTDACNSPGWHATAADESFEKIGRSENCLTAEAVQHPCRKEERQHGHVSWDVKTSVSLATHLQAAQTAEGQPGDTNFSIASSPMGETKEARERRIWLEVQKQERQIGSIRHGTGGGSVSKHGTQVEKKEMKEQKRKDKKDAMVEQKERKKLEHLHDYLRGHAKEQHGQPESAAWEANQRSLIRLHVGALGLLLKLTVGELSLDDLSGAREAAEAAEISAKSPKTEEEGDDECMDRYEALGERHKELYIKLGLDAESLDNFMWNEDVECDLIAQDGVPLSQSCDGVVKAGILTSQPTLHKDHDKTAPSVGRGHLVNNHSDYVEGLRRLVMKLMEHPSLGKYKLTIGAGEISQVACNETEGRLNSQAQHTGQTLKFIWRNGYAAQELNVTVKGSEDLEEVRQAILDIASSKEVSKARTKEVGMIKVAGAQQTDELRKLEMKRSHEADLARQSEAKWKAKEAKEHRSLKAVKGAKGDITKTTIGARASLNVAIRESHGNARSKHSMRG